MFISFIYAPLHGLVKPKACQQGSRDPFGPGHSVRFAKVGLDAQAAEVIAVVHWKGGVHTELRIPRRRRGYSRAHTPKEIVDAVRVLVHICSDDTIAGALTRSGLVTGMGN